MHWDWANSRLIWYDKINPMKYIFHPETDTFTVVYTEYDEDYALFYERACEEA